MKYMLFFALLSCIVVEAHPIPPTAHGITPQTISASPAAGVSMADEILKYINAYRRKKGLPPMAMNTVMSAEAQKHSENMAARRTSFGHNGFQHRLKRISPALNGLSGAAENVAMGSTTAKEVVDNWLKSSVHKQNIEGAYNLTGIGVAPDKKGVLYFTQIFASN
ncbi:MAG TPA: CAP domain-containing protein [Niastella sp.]